MNDDELRQQIERLQAELAKREQAAQTQTHTGGGAAVLGDVKTQRDFIGRDKILLIVKNYADAGGYEQDKKRLEEQIVNYLKWLKEISGRIEMRGIEKAWIPLDNAYIPLEATVTVDLDTEPHAEGLLKSVLRRVGIKSRNETPDETRMPEHRVETFEVQLNQILQLGNRLVVIGGPGSGKTTVLLHIAWALATSILHRTNEAHDRLGIVGELPLPILVPLASFSNYLQNLKSDTPARQKTLAHFISEHLISKQSGIDLPNDFFSRLLQSGRDVMLLLDGLDEVANDDDRALVSEQVKTLVAGKDALRTVVTCRTIAYQDRRTVLIGFKEIAVKPLDFDQHVIPMVSAAYTCIHENDLARRKTQTDDLLNGIRQLEDDRRELLGDDAELLVTSPLMVRNLLIVHYNNHTLPDQRAELFEQTVDAILQIDHAIDESVRQKLSRDWKTHRDMAQHVAYHMHERGEKQGRVIDEKPLRDMLKKENDFAPFIDGFIAQARMRGGLLEERNGTYRFFHHAFQEFLTARYIREVIGGSGMDAMFACLDDDKLTAAWWREPILLLSGYLSSKAMVPAREFLKRLSLSGNSANSQFSAAELAAVASLEWRDCGDDTRKALAALIAERIVDEKAAWASQPIFRARAGKALARLGDPRKGVGCVRIGESHVPDIDWVLIEDKAPFIYGEGKTKTSMRVASFEMSRYPVTVAQYQAFLDADDGFKNPEWWRELSADVEHKSQPRLPAFKHANHPAHNVSWYDAIAFCKWLSFKLQREISLPSEQQWEKAARGADGRAYPWGGDKYQEGFANVNETTNKVGRNYLQETSTVGMYPHGRSRYGILDMCGNVWEWCMNVYDDTSRTQLSGSASRVLRGGSWGYYESSARCANRSRGNPDSWGRSGGFRLVCRPKFSS
jgi:formylglycine-generating enzyme required for sulfatase activity